MAWEVGLQVDELREHAVAVGMRCSQPQWARDAIRKLANDASSPRLAVQAAGAFGDPSVVSWLLERLGDQACARVVGEAIALITGADLEYLDLDAQPPEDADTYDEMHPEDAQLRWPGPAALRRWWAQHKDSLQPGTRYLCGQPVAAAAVQVLRSGYQRQRAAAAIELLHRGMTSVLFPVKDRADRQRQRLAP
jgi:uncharacterized protein (TIGR02270 family)